MLNTLVLHRYNQEKKLKKIEEPRCKAEQPNEHDGEWVWSVGGGLVCGVYDF